MKGALQAAGYAKEDIFGTPKAPTATLLLVGQGVRGDDENDIQPVLANASFPDPHTQELMKQTHKVSINSLLYESIADALVAMGNTRTLNDLDSYTITKNAGFSGGGDQWAGCKCGSMSIKWDAGGFVEISHEFTAKSRSATTFSPSTYPTTHPFHGSHVTVTVNEVPATAVFNGELTWNNNLEEGPVGSDYKVAWLEAGFREFTGRIQAKFSDDAWNVLVRDLEDGEVATFTVAIVFTDSAGESTTITITNCRAKKAPNEVGQQGETVKQTLEFVGGTVELT